MTMHTSRWLMSAALALGLLGCKKNDDAAAKPGTEATKPAPGPAHAAGCGPMVVKVDGVAVTDLRPGLSATLKNGVYETEQVELYSSDKITCAEVLAPSFSFPEGAVSIRAYYHPQAQGLGTEAYTEMGVHGITLVAKAGKLGDPTSICVPAGAVFTPNTGSFAGKRLEISGTLSGAYCGVKDMTATK